MYFPLFLLNQKNLKMDLGASLTVLIFTLILVVPFILIKRKSGQKGKQLRQELFALAEADNLKIVQFDAWNNSVIGLDDKNEQLIFISNIKSEKTVRQIPLRKILKTRVINTNRTAGQNNTRIIDKLELAFMPKVSSEPEILLEFYNSDHDLLVLSGELQLVEKWAKIINDICAKN